MVFLFFVLIFSSLLYGQIFYKEGDVSYVYNSWINACTNEEVNVKPIFLRQRNSNLNSNYCNQIFANPDIISNQSGIFYIYGYGDEDLSNTERGDAIFFIKRNLLGKYDVEKGCSGAITPILYFNDDPANEWYKVGAIAQGMAVIYSSTPDACGHHYFGILPVDDKGDRALEDLPGDKKYQDDR